MTIATATGEREITLGDIAQGSPESLLYVLGRQLETLSGTRRVQVVEHMKRLVASAEADELHAAALKERDVLLRTLGIDPASLQANS